MPDDYGLADFDKVKDIAGFEKRAQELIDELEATDAGGGEGGRSDSGESTEDDDDEEGDDGLPTKMNKQVLA